MTVFRIRIRVRAQRRYPLTLLTVWGGGGKIDQISPNYAMNLLNPGSGRLEGLGEEGAGRGLPGNPGIPPALAFLGAFDVE